MSIPECKADPCDGQAVHELALALNQQILAMGLLPIAYVHADNWVRHKSKKKQKKQHDRVEELRVTPSIIISDD
jgi:hypothetical protein